MPAVRRGAPATAAPYNAGIPCGGCATGRRPVHPSVSTIRSVAGSACPSSPAITVRFAAITPPPFGATERRRRNGARIRSCSRGACACPPKMNMLAHARDGRETTPLSAYTAPAGAVIRRITRHPCAHSPRYVPCQSRSTAGSIAEVVKLEEMPLAMQTSRSRSSADVRYSCGAT